jgi:sigma-B regulation protein RsbU (phosphoserine phosphatase)
MAYLHLVGTSEQEGRYELLADQCLIGRLKRCHINIGGDGRDVSRKHASVTRGGSDWFVKDMDSRNHTYVNGVEIHGSMGHKLAHGDCITICGNELVFNSQNHPEDDSSSVLIHEGDPANVLDGSSALSLSDSSGRNASAKLSVLMRIARSLQNTLSLDQVLSQTLDSLFEVFPSARRGVIGFWDEGEFHPKWWKLRDADSPAEIKVSMTVVQQVVDRQEALLVDNAITQFPDQESVAGLSIVSLMCAPMIDADGDVFGVFQIDATTEHGFSLDDLELMATVAIQVSFAINYVRLHQQTLMQKAIAKDLELARDVQREFLPSAPPSVPGYEFADYYEPARFIGGDYFDYVTLADGCIAVVLADVVGKGAPAALYMARLAMETRACIEQFDGAAAVISELNRRLHGRFATYVICLLNPASHVVTVVNAGHQPPVCRRADGSLEKLGESVSEFPFSVQYDVEFEEAHYQLDAGESVCVFSDGFDEAHNEFTDDYFGIERINVSIQESAGSATETVTELVRRTKEFSAGSMQFDDMCIVAFRRVT